MKKLFENLVRLGIISDKGEFTGKVVLHVKENEIKNVESIKKINAEKFNKDAVMR